MMEADLILPIRPLWESRIAGISGTNKMFGMECFGFLRYYEAKRMSEVYVFENLV